MTPQERKLVEDLFERLATLERNPREADAEEAIRTGLRRAPNATYALVQTVLPQDEALRQANERIRELEGAEPPQDQGGGGFLDLPAERIEQVTNVNYLGSVWTLRAFLPLLEAGAEELPPDAGVGQVVGDGERLAALQLLRLRQRPEVDEGEGAAGDDGSATAASDPQAPRRHPFRSWLRRVFGNESKEGEQRGTEDGGGEGKPPG